VIDWWVWRPVVSPHLHVSLVEVTTQWTLSDLLDAHIMLNLLDGGTA